MVRILIFVILAAIALTFVYFTGKSASKKKFTILLGGGILSAAVGVFMQTAFPLYQALLGMVGVALLVALAYMKLLEKEQVKNQQMIEERRNSKIRVHSSSPEPAKKRFHEPVSESTHSMKTITVVREEQKVE